MDDGREHGTVASVERAFDVVETLREMDGGRVTAVAERTGLAKSTVHRYLTTLERREYLVKRGDSYHVSHRFLDLGEYTRIRRSEYQLAKEKVPELAEETEERVQFMVEEHGWAVYLYRESGAHAVQTDSRIGARVHLHSTAAGKAILAHLPEPRIEVVVERHGLPELTEHTITDREELAERLRTIRERGYSRQLQENTKGLRSVGVPIMDDNDGVIGAISISGPTHRLKGEWFEQEIPDLLLGAANEIELNIAYS